jgi:deoxyribodipyrimidine photo-lyase
MSLVVSDDRSVLPFQGGETTAYERLEHYCQQGCIDRYKQTRNGMVGADYSTKMSPWLAVGAVSARSILQRVKRFEKETGIANEDTYWVIFELLWRDYMRYYGLQSGTRLFKLLGCVGSAAQTKYPWRRDDTLFNAWATGNTGYPFIDANMRELAITGFMSNRGRQNVASFLVRDLGLDWRLGAKHFERYLLDYDPCSNYGNWQYAAGVGSDPREDRYFNIVKQASQYDPDGSFIRLWCPELSRVPTQVLHNPTLLTAKIRSDYGIGSEVYPAPIAKLMHGEYTPKPAYGSNKQRKPNHGGVPGLTFKR